MWVVRNGAAGLGFCCAQAVAFARLPVDVLLTLIVYGRRLYSRSMYALCRACATDPATSSTPARDGKYSPGIILHHAHTHCIRTVLHMQPMPYSTMRLSYAQLQHRGSAYGMGYATRENLPCKDRTTGSTAQIQKRFRALDCAATPTREGSLHPASALLSHFQYYFGKSL